MGGRVFYNPADRPATFDQRRALFNMYTALGRDVVGIRNMTQKEASDAIDAAKKQIEEEGLLSEPDTV